MIWLHFDSNGILKETLQPDSIQAGTDYLEIFAVFEGADSAGFTGANLKLYKPDLEHTSYLPLPMYNETKKFLVSEVGHSDYFTDNTDYRGFYFNFSSFLPDDDPTVLLDTAGLWRVVITLYAYNNSQVRYVIGNATFAVGAGNENEEGEELTVDQALDAYMAALAQKADITYVKENFVRKLETSSDDTTTMESSLNNVLEIGANPIIYGLEISGAGNYALSIVPTETEGYADLILYDLDNYKLVKVSDAELADISLSDLLDDLDSDGETIATSGQIEQLQAALDNKRDIITSPNRIYATDNMNRQSSLSYTQAVVPQAVVTRTNYGQILVPETPNEVDAATSKGYVDSGLIGKQDKLIAGTNISISENNVISATVESMHYEVVSSLPATGEDNVIYLVPKQDGQAQDVYNEYIWVNNAFEFIGTTAADFSACLPQLHLTLSDEDYTTTSLSTIFARFGLNDTIYGSALLLAVTIDGDDEENYPGAHYLFSIHVSDEDPANALYTIQIFDINNNKWGNIEDYPGSYTVEELLSDIKMWNNIYGATQPLLHIDSSSTDYTTLSIRDLIEKSCVWPLKEGEPDCFLLNVLIDERYFYSIEFKDWLHANGNPVIGSLEVFACNGGSNIVPTGALDDSYIWSDTLDSIITKINTASLDVATALSAKENSSNKVTSLSSSNTDIQYPSAKCVYDLIKALQETATGNSRSYVACGTDTIEGVKTVAQDVTIYDDMGNDISAAVFNGDYDSYTYVNADLRSQTGTLSLVVNQQYIILRAVYPYYENSQVQEGEWPNYIVMRLSHLRVKQSGQVIPAMKLGDNLFLIETDYPDRWCSFNGEYDHDALIELSALETQKVDLSSYVDLTTAQTISGGDKTFDTSTMLRFKTQYNTYASIGTTGSSGYNVQVSGATFAFTTGIQTKTLNPYGGTGTVDIGASNNAFKDLYLSGDINPNSSGYGYTLLRTTSFTSDKTIASVEDLSGFNAYSSSQTYAVGDKVVYGGKLYRCSTAITTAESWDSTHWTEITLSDVLYKDETAQVSQLTFTYNPTTYYLEANASGILLRAGGNPILLRGNTRPADNNNWDLGSSTLQWRDAYFTGQVYAQNTYNVLNASDVNTSSITAEQIAIFTNGKQTRIDGTLLSIVNPTFLPFYQSGSTYFSRVYGISTIGTMIDCICYIYNNSLSLDTGRIEYNLSGNKVNIANLNMINNKAIPSYPSSTGIFVLKCVDGVLTWVAE